VETLNWFYGKHGVMNYPRREEERAEKRKWGMEEWEIEEGWGCWN